MYLIIAIDDRTIKRNWTWDFEGCKDCAFRFGCYTEDVITIKPTKITIEYEIYDWVKRSKYKAEFHLPKCVRLGLFKQIADTGFSSTFPSEFGDGFKLGGVVGDAEERVTMERSWVKFPDTLYVIGHMR
jgi:hypothetical protein